MISRGGLLHLSTLLAACLPLSVWSPLTWSA